MIPYMQRQKEASARSVGYWWHSENKHKTNYKPEILLEFPQKERRGGSISEEKSGSSTK